MRLKSLELVGFKSFLEPTSLGFSSGITAVVGPNGCGKSNVVDAIRWVLGEQAPTRLRGKTAEDLIYAGNDANAAANLAEVTLVLEAEEGSALPEPYAALSEVAVTRRVYRSSDAEYLLNKIPCRLKDVTEFFMAAQIHSRGYSLIEQGRIEEIIQAKPAELRAMVEEAAGLSLFKGRREMSERKLERVRENLARVEDVVSEIERQLSFARRQAKKAEAYKLIRAELAELEKIVAARRLQGQHRELARESSRENELAALAAEALGRVVDLENEAAQAVATLAAARDELASGERELENLRAACAERARTRAFLERRVAAIDERAPELAERLKELGERAAAARAARAAAGATLARELTAGDSAAAEAALAALREDHRAADNAAREGERRVEELKDELAELMREAAVIRGRLGDLAGERAELDERVAALALAAPELEATAERAREALATAETALAASRIEASRCDAVQRESAGHEIELRASIEHHAARVAVAREAKSAAFARAQRIIPNHAGERLRGVLESLNGERPAVGPAMLLDVVKAPPALEPALRAVLGEQLDAVIVDSPHFAVRAIEILKERVGGRLSFIPESIAPAGTHPPLSAAGIPGRLIDMVEIEPRFAPIAEALIGHVLVADDLRAALAASNLNGFGTVFVTREGDLLAPDRLISGGSGHRSETDDEIDMRKRALALDEAIQAAAAAEAAHEELTRSWELARLAYRDDVDALETARAGVSDCERAVTELRGELARTEQEIETNGVRRASAERRVAEIGALAASANARLEQLARDEQGQRARLAGAAEELAARRASARALGDAMLEAGARFEARKGALHALEQELNHARRIAGELEAQIAQYGAEQERARAEREEFASELTKLATQDEASIERRRELEAIVAEIEERCAACERAAAAIREALEKAREQLAAHEAGTLECRLACERARALIGELERTFQEKFGADFRAMAGELEPILEARDAVLDEQRVAELRAKAERIGEVNLAAESEVQELEQRSNVLTAERGDLQTAVNDLTHTIQKLNREARRRLAETFTGASKNFEELFPKLLRGGRGRLELTAGDDVLEAGVNILVQPAGKKVKEIGLLSGGEKALSAMALIFSLFLLNPSPFCVMDEVDAPLDEFSLAAFTGLLGELKQRSQFIVITHNQRTMQAADHIHGVTMERPGISRIISLKIPEAA